MSSLETTPSPVETVMNMALGYLISRSLHVAAELAIADHLHDGPLTSHELARRCQAQAASLERLLRSLAAHGVFAEDDQGRFANTPASSLLCAGVMRDGVLLCGEVAGDGSWWNAVGALHHTVATGEPAFDHQHGVGFFDYVGARPHCSAWFDRGMANFASAENPAIASAHHFDALRHVVDVGGGQGGLLAQVLQRQRGLHATLFDRPQVVRNPIELQADEQLAGRWSVIGGDFFEAIPPGADAYILKRILHDWGDEPSLRILRRCREAMQPHARLLVVDAVLPEGNAPHPGKVMDILMMVFATGRERRASEFTALFERAGLELVGITPTASTLSIVEARPA